MRWKWKRWYSIPSVFLSSNLLPSPVCWPLCQCSVLLDRHGIRQVRSMDSADDNRFEVEIEYEWSLRQRTCSMTSVDMRRNISRTSVIDRSIFSSSEWRSRSSRNLFRSVASCSNICENIQKFLKLVFDAERQSVDSRFPQIMMLCCLRSTLRFPLRWCCDRLWGKNYIEKFTKHSSLL